MRSHYTRQNLVVICAQVAAWLACLLALAQSPPLPVALAILLFFCLMMQGVFSMMHEAFHRHAHPDARVNEALGVVLSTMFGTSYTLFRVNHAGHHRRNRTRAELVDYVLPGESRWRKTLAYYSAIVGGIWLAGLVGSIVFSLTPYAAVRRRLAAAQNNTYVAALADFTAADWQRVRLETVLLLAFHGACLALGAWEWSSLLAAYAAFAFSWSSLQWVYHMRTPLDVVEGAYNLRLPRPLRWLFLNFNYNLTHHRQPELPWQQLHAASDASETRPLWFNYLQMVRPPEPLPAGAITKTYF